MANDDKQYELIESYLEGTLSEQERKEVEKKLQTDPAFAMAYQQQLAILEAIEYKGNEALRPQLDQIYKEEVLNEQASTSIRKLSIFSRLSIAASVLLVLSIGLWLLLRPPAHERLFTAYYEKPSATMFRDDQTAASQDALDAYQDNQFSEALLLLEEIEGSNNATPEDILLMGICYLETGNYPKAQNTFQALGSNSNWRDAATWYLALTYLQQNQSEEALSLLRPLADGSIPTGPARQRKAQGLIDQLEKK